MNNPPLLTGGHVIFGTHPKRLPPPPQGLFPKFGFGPKTGSDISRTAVARPNTCPTRKPGSVSRGGGAKAAWRGRRHAGLRLRRPHRAPLGHAGRYSPAVSIVEKGTEIFWFHFGDRGVDGSGPSRPPHLLGPEWAIPGRRGVSHIFGAKC